ncbi:NUDIX domain-containing protein [Psychrobacillus lasiicapitis]|uniref:NUDIX hydrolase n=1 Tax=Psychrobacillus lasiicapitis TaxID=1636719 RepID=A0A544T055_9BACI|nr:NUDIX hydrolase [Psychrobacillus lasiicapitis]TQR10814.1 NUDIX hydrolase [Psychrobacillus lasiicapitis]GGA42265.1 NUDIX hydrolase [Psychrobacillus lasiicapitis]
MTRKDRGNVWLGVAGLVINYMGEWLVVKKRYGGLDGRWSLPAGFVNNDETVDEAALREVKEETGVECLVQHMIGFRSGVIENKVSDNMAIFLLHPIEKDPILQAQLSELYEVKWIHPSKLLHDENASVMIRELAEKKFEDGFSTLDGINPGDVFGYTSYKLFIK